jgi:hypothetical protein
MTTEPITAAANVKTSIAAHGRAALAELDSLAPGDPDASKKLSEVMRQLVSTRDDLIAARRLGAACRPQLQRTNALISSIFGVEFPVAGVQWQRVCDTREALRQLVNEAAPEAARRGA